jgi:hypothetical protein
MAEIIVSDLRDIVRRAGKAKIAAMVESIAISTASKPTTRIMNRVIQWRG